MKVTETPFRIVDRARRMGESSADWSLACFVLRDTPEILADESLRSLAFAAAKDGSASRNDFEALAEYYLVACNKASDAAAYARALEDAAKAVRASLPRAHTYASESADLYRAQDAIIERAIAAICKLGEDA